MWNSPSTRVKENAKRESAKDEGDRDALDGKGRRGRIASGHRTSANLVLEDYWNACR
jgi:hypothetical protein